MIGKLIGALVGRSVAKKNGMSALWGAAAGLFAPALIKRGGSMIAHAGRDAAARRQERKQPVYLAPVASRSGRTTSARRRRRR